VRTLHPSLNWPEINAKLPVDRTPEQQAMRAMLFKHGDINGNGFLSLAEAWMLLREVLKIDAVIDLKPVTMRAFVAAKGLGIKFGLRSLGDDHIEKKEFRMMLVYVKEFLAIWDIFATADTSHDRCLTKAEFTACFPKLKKYAPNESVDQVWKEMNSGKEEGLVLFDEFCAWSLSPNRHFGSFVGEPDE
jgi:hypothetical protein